MLKTSDLVSGAIVAAIGTAIMVQSAKFPAAGGIAIAPSVYPSVIGAELALLGGAIALRSLLRREFRPVVESPAWLRPGRPLVAVLASLVAIAAYAILAPKLGFLVTSTGVVFALLLAFGVRPAVSVGVAVLISA